jgi:hypothetical protein
VVNLRDKRAHSVDNVTATLASSANYFRSRAMCGQHDGATLWYFVDAVNKHHSLCTEAIHHHFVVNDFVIAVHGSLEGSNHPCQCLYRHLNTSTEATR